MNSRFSLLGVLLVAGIAASYALTFVGAREGGTQTAAQEARIVGVVSAEEGSLTATRITSVFIEPAQESAVAAGTSGRIQSLLKREDMEVAEGEPVARIDTTELEMSLRNAQLAAESARVALQRAQQANQEDQVQAGQRLRTAEATLRVAQQKYDEGRKLLGIGAMAPSEVALLEAEFASAQSGYRLAQDSLSRSLRASGEDLEILRLQLQQSQNQIEQLERDLAEATVVAPFAGEITEFFVNEGEFIRAGEPVFQLASSSEQVARFSVPLDIADRLEEQGLIWIRYGDLQYAAQVLSRSRVDVEAQLVEITAQLYPSQTRIPNGVVTPLPYTYEAARGIILPADAVRRDAGETFVWALQDGRAFRQYLVVLGESDGEVAVSGVPEGTQVVYPVPSNIREGAEFQVQEAP